MKPRHLFRASALFGTPLRYGAPVALGLVVLITGAEAGDLLRGGAGGPGAKSRQPAGAAATPAASAAARANARDQLARTTRAVNSMRALQQAARQNAKTGKPAALALRPKLPTARPVLSVPPAIPDGLAPGGLQPHRLAATDTSTWSGARLPVQTTTGKGRVQVTVRQTEQQALLKWDSFHIGKNTTLTFDQSKGGENRGKWIAFNQVSDPSASPSRILGNLKADGQVYLINPNGVIFGAGSSVNARGLTVSSLPINTNLIARGLLNNPDSQFLFSALPVPGGAEGTPAFNPEPSISPDGKFGDVVVEAGARIRTPVAADGNGGRIALVGANVRNSGELVSTAGQVILAGGLQVGFSAHDSSDPSLRGLDVYVGAVIDPDSTFGPYAGSAVNDGLIRISRGSAWMTGKDVSQLGVIESSTSVSLNGRIDLTANYDAYANTAATEDDAPPFLFKSTGSITLGGSSVSRILPELDSKDTTVGTELALRSRISFQGKTIRLEDGASLIAPNAVASMAAGRWIYNESLRTSAFVSTGGQIHVGSGSVIDLSGTRGVKASVSDNLLTLELRGAELAPSPLQRDGKLRGETITVDLGESGTFEGRDWIGTPLADVSGYVDLVRRNVAQLTTAGGSLEMSAGSSVVMGQGSLIDVSGGWTNYQGGTIRTTMVLSGGRIIDIASARPDQTYDGIYKGSSSVTDTKWGVSNTYIQGLAPGGSRFREGYVTGADAGSVTISAPAMALDGTLSGTTRRTDGAFRDTRSTAFLPKAASLTLNFRSQDPLVTGFPNTYPTPPRIVIGGSAPELSTPVFSTDANGDPAPLGVERESLFHLSPELLAGNGFTRLTLRNEGGDIVLPSATDLKLPEFSHLSFTAANIDLQGSIHSPGGVFSFAALNQSPYDLALRSPEDPLPPPDPARGSFTLGSGSILSTAGRVLDDRRAADFRKPVAISGGSVQIAAFNVDLRKGGLIDVSGGYHLPQTGAGVFGDAGAIRLSAGQDLTLPAVTGGSISLGSSLRGLSGAASGSLAIQAPLIRIGGEADHPQALTLDPSFFSRGGFSSFSLTGLGVSGDQGLPAVSVAPGTVVRPRVLGLKAEITPGASASGVELIAIREAEGDRNPASIRLSAPGVSDSGGLVIRGDVVVGEGAVVRTDPGGSVSITGNTVAVLGSIIAPGGVITVGGSSNSSSVFGDPARALVTTRLGSQSLLSAAGAVVTRFDAFGRRIGAVLDGGNITVSGNIAAETGSRIDASGADGWLDVDPATLVLAGADRPGGASGLNRPPGALEVVRTKVFSAGGSITLRGGQMLFSDAALSASSGGGIAGGGSLTVSSGRFYGIGATPLPTDVNLAVSQSGAILAGGEGAIGSAPAGTAGDLAQSYGRLAVSSFEAGGFDSLSLGGVIRFDGAVSIRMARSIEAASGGILHAGSGVSLAAPQVSLGRRQLVPVPDEDRTPPFQLNEQPYAVPPTHGAGVLEVDANFIDLGDLSLQGIGRASLHADGGDLSGNGTVAVAGAFDIVAGQIHPHASGRFNLIALDQGDGPSGQGSIQVRASGGLRPVPLSAAGTLTLDASQIVQEGVLRAPFGVIRIGWDGTGDAPVNDLIGEEAGYPVTRSLVLGEGSVTSVSAVDPRTGKGIVIPYGVSPDGNTWIDPEGRDITSSGPPAKGIRLSALDLTTVEGSSVDLRGGGDLYAYRWVKGLGGPEDVLDSDSVFAILPDYGSIQAPSSPFNNSTDASNGLAGQGAGYVNPGLRAGDRIYLEGSRTLKAGYYTLLPARYALLEGGVLVSPSSDEGVSTVERADRSSLVSGFRFNGLNGEPDVPVPGRRYELAASKVFRKRAEYRDFLATSFLGRTISSSVTTLRSLPKDSASLALRAVDSMRLAGSVSSPSISGGYGSLIDISSAAGMAITDDPASSPQVPVVLDAGILNGYEAASLLIGGRRSFGSEGVVISSESGSIVIQTPDKALEASDLILASSGSITLASGSELASSGSSVGTAFPVSVSGAGTLVRVSSDPGASASRLEVATGNASLVLEDGVSIRGGVVTLDSSSAMKIAPTVDLTADSLALGSGRIGIVLDPGAAPAETGGLLLQGKVLGDLSKPDALSLLSYSTIDLHGSGTFGSDSLRYLSLGAAAIRRSGDSSGGALFQADSITLSNPSGAETRLSSGAIGGTLRLEAEVITLGENDVRVANYDSLELSASSRITGFGKGSLRSGGSIHLTAPLLTGYSGAVRSISAAGDLRLTGASQSGNAAADGAGSVLSLTGSSVDLGGNILLPGGALSASATEGDLRVAGDLDVSGFRTTVRDVTRFQNAGSIRLESLEGNISLDSGSGIRVNALEGGGDAGSLLVSAPNGIVTFAGGLSAQGGKGGENGSVGIDTGLLPELAGIGSLFTNAGFTRSQSFRVRYGDVLVDGLQQASSFLLSADRGSINVAGTIDASGATGGDIRLTANGDLAITGGSRLTVAGRNFDSAGRGGDITLEAGAQTGGIQGDGSLFLLEGSILDLTVSSMVPGDESVSGSSASSGRFSGTLHLRAPRTSDGKDVAVSTIGSAVVGASGIVVEAAKLYDLTSAGGLITAADRAAIRSDAEAFLGTSGSASGTYNAIHQRLLANQPGLDPVFLLTTGVEIINRSGDLVLGSADDSVANDWDLSGFRLGPKGAAGFLTLRASGNLVFSSALSDGFTPTLPEGDATRLWLARPTLFNPQLPVTLQSWSYRLTAGADLDAADHTQTLPSSSLLPERGFLNLGNPQTNVANSGGGSASTASAIASSINSSSNAFQVIRTGSGDIEINAAAGVRLLNQFATIYSAGTRAADPTLGGLFDLPNLGLIGMDASLGSPQQTYPATYTRAGGNVSIRTGGNIERLTRAADGSWIADSQLQLPNNWLYRRGYVDPVTGTWGTNRWSESASTTWWIDFSNFFQGVGALGGGHVRLDAGGDISNVDAVIPTNVRMTGYTDVTRSVKQDPESALLLEFGGGDLTVRAGGDIDAGVYYVERGSASLSAGGSIHTNATRSVVNAGTASPYSELPTTLFLGKGSFNVSAGGDVLLGPVANPFLLPGGLGNSFWHKSYFSTYGARSSVDVTSTGGSVTLRTASTAPGQSEGVADPLLQSWITNKQLLSSFSASDTRPWLRLSENNTSPFETLVSLMPGTLRVAAPSGDIRLAGSLTLTPSASGTVDLIAGASVDGLQPNGSVTLQSGPVTTWGSSTINLSDADPSAIPGFLSPFAYHVIAGDNPNAASITSTELRFLDFIDRLFRETGVTDSVIETKQALHDSGPLHRNDPSPLRIYADAGDVSGITLFSPKETFVLAGRDVQDVALYLQNLRDTDASIVNAGRDIIFSQANSPQRVAATSVGNATNLDSAPLPGDLQISGPGMLQVIAGRHLDLGTGSGNSDGTGVGITSIGNARNPALPAGGAHLVVAAGTSSPLGLAASALDFDAFIRDYVDTEKGAKYLKEVAPGVDFDSLEPEERARVSLEVFYRILRDAGRAYSKTGNYKTALKAVKTLFGDGSFAGDILTRGRDIRTASGGNIDIIAPGGGLSMAETVIGNPLSPPGIITSGGGDISMFARNDISIGIGRIFTLRGGDEIIWSSKGDIAAGASSKTVKSAPPTRVLIDPQSAWVETDLAGLATGGGIGVLATVAGVKPGNVDLIAPEGTVDAGDAGIRVSGNLNIAATQVLNAGNISVSGSSTGTPAPVSIGGNVGGLTAAASASAAATSTAQEAPRNSESPSTDEDAPSINDNPSIFTVEILGYGDGSADEDDEEDQQESIPEP